MVPLHLRANLDILFNINAQIHFKNHPMYQLKGLLGTIDWKLLPNEDFFTFVKMITLEKTNRTIDKTAALILSLEKVTFIFNSKEDDFTRIQNQIFFLMIMEC